MVPGLAYTDAPLASDKAPKGLVQSDIVDEESLIEPIAVVGLSLKFPGDATSPEAFWKMIVEKRCAMTDVPADRFNIDAFQSTDKSSTSTIIPRGGHFVEEDLSLFDAPFFSITSTEAASMDVQQRQLLECVYRALENAGMPLEAVNGSNTSVHAGSFADDYRLMTMRDHENMPKHAATGSSISILANRISWFYNLRGPSLQLDTACSSSLIALDLACQGLRAGESNMALVAGSNTVFGMDTYLILSNMNFLSPDSKCYSFDHRANGYARGEGFGVLVLKRLTDAIRDGDTIRSVIRSTGSNSDGRTPGITQPSGEAQEQLIRETYKKAGLSLSHTRFFEAHGTGTAVGDPIEAHTIGRAFGKYRSPDDPMYVGSVKTNVGHLEGTSGVAGVIKTILALEKGTIPPNTNFERPNPRIDAPSLNLQFPQQPIPWPSDGLRRASVNSFGFGGSNAHVVLDDAYNFLKIHHLIGFHTTSAVPPTPDEITRSQIILNVEDSMARRSENGLEGSADINSNPALLVWSAADEAGIKRLNKAYNAHFHSLDLTTEQKARYLSDLAYTLSDRRSILPWRSFATVNSLSNITHGELSFHKALRSSRKLGMGFVFTGQGAQFAGMGRELLMYPVFRNTLHRAQLYLCELGCQWSLIEELLLDKTASKINRPDMSQPLCTALQIALVELLLSFNITPKAVIGHSSGEIAAAYCMGGISLRSAVKVAFLRGKLAAQLAETSTRKCSMMAVGLSEAQATAYIDRLGIESNILGIVVACINSPTSVTISGDETQMNSLEQLLVKDSIFARKLKVNVGYHSPQMREIEVEYLRQLGQLDFGKPLPGCEMMVSSVTNKVITMGELANGSYWVKNLISPVRFSDALVTLVSSGAKSGRKKLGGPQNTKPNKSIIVYDFIELGPHSALAGPVKNILKTIDLSEDISYASCLTRNTSALETTMAAAGRLWCQGYPVNITLVNRFEVTKSRPKMTLVDLPEYPFDHSQSYWHESRVSREYRLRKHPHLDLLGTESKNSNPLQAQWTKFIRISETPWVADHVVNGSTIYPAAGMLVMAFEGTRQLVSNNKASRALQGYRITEATFHRALVVDLSTEQGTESQVYIRPIQDSTGKESSQFEFRICTLEGGHWGENCHGFITAEYEESSPNEIDGVFAAERTKSIMSNLLNQRTHACSQSTESTAVYDHFHGMGLQFGPTFQTLRNIKFSENGEAIADVKAFQWNDSDDNKTNLSQLHLVHPTTLDGFIQVVLVGLTRGATKNIPTTVPTRITNLWLSASGLSHPEIDSLQVTSCQLSKGARQTESSFVVFDQDGHLRASVGVLETTNVDRQETGDGIDGDKRRKLCYNMDWKPDIDLIPSSQGAVCFDAEKLLNCQQADFYQDLAIFLYATIARTLTSLDPGRTDPSRTSYIEWMKLQIHRFNSNNLDHAEADWIVKIDDTEYLQRLSNRLEQFSSEGRFYVEVARCLLPILYGELDPLQVLFSGDLVKQYYLEINDRLSGVFAKLFDLMAHKNPSLKILEIGAGTGGTTAHVMKPLFPSPDVNKMHGMVTPRYSRYDFTDISPSFFEKAREDFQLYSSRMQYLVLDIEQNPAEQGFELGSYDVVLAANVIHATKNLDITLKNAHALLKSGGKLVMLEQTGDFARGGFAFGLLPGWWLSEDDYRSWGPTMTPQKWNNVLESNGFSGTDFVLDDYDDEKSQELSIIVSTARQPDKRPMALPGISLIVRRDSPTQGRIAGDLHDAVSAEYGVSCEISYLEDDKTPMGCFCIFLVEFDSPLLCTIDEETFETLKGKLLSAQKLIWVTGGGGSSWEYPGYHAADGLLRGLRTENAMLQAVTLALENKRAAHHAAGIIQRVLQTILHAEGNDMELEYREQDGILLINRVIECDRMNEHIHTSVQPQKSITQPFGAPNLPPLALQFRTPGLLDSLRFVEDEVASRPLQPHQVEIEIKAVGVNFMDLLTALGRINQAEIGGECAGIISRIGSVKHTDLRPGDRVCAVAFDCFKTFGRADARTVVKIPGSVSFTEAAALPVTYTTAHYALMVAGRLRKGDKVLIHAAAGGTGQSAVQLAQHAGAEVFATVGSMDKRQLLIDRYGIKEDHIFYSRDISFAQGVMWMTNNLGVDLVLNSLAGDGLTASWECMASFGRFVEIGKRDIHAHSRLDMFYFAKNVSFTAVDVFGMTKERPALVRESLMATLDLVAAGHAQASYPVQSFPVSDLERALRLMQSGKSVGKLVIEMNKEANVLTVLNSGMSYTLDPKATYVIAGGFGGIARRTARWMVERGARYLLLLSRSGPKSKQAHELIEELRGLGVQLLAPQCDVASMDSLAAVLAECAATMAPIKGCIQGAMVLRDAMFDKMTHEEWMGALLPKVDGSRALDRLLPSGMDFFIMLSSVVGIHGSAGQSNYAAGGTYQDALARDRVNRGERAIALDLGWMASDGIIAESKALTKSFATAGLMLPINSDEYLALLDYYCNPDIKESRDLRTCQIMVGLETPAGLVAKGADVPALLQRPIFRYMHAMGHDEGASTEDGANNAVVKNWAAAFKSARSSAEASDLVVEGLTHKLSRALSIQPDDIDVARPLHSYGVDSLLAVELRSWFAKEFKSDIAVFEIMSAGNFTAVATAVISKTNHQAGWEEI
ncbi:reducing type I polyketide synthase [Penicillium angulare]|uniref:Reducing type I polyketide synthase n=1 Tax=Penicillium angulare TaxID=116970 RepID=A0A9W9KQ43_9EURO|nr:reducing type I polyketide synthase [Penicillium angulare]